MLSSLSNCYYRNNPNLVKLTKLSIFSCLQPYPWYVDCESRGTRQHCGYLYTLVGKRWIQAELSGRGGVPGVPDPGQAGLVAVTHQAGEQGATRGSKVRGNYLND